MIESKIGIIVRETSNEVVGPVLDEIGSGKSSTVTLHNHVTVGTSGSGFRCPIISIKREFSLTTAVFLPEVSHDTSGIDDALPRNVADTMTRD